MEMMCVRGMGAVRLRLPYAPANGQLRFRSLYFVGARMIVTWAPTQCEGRGMADDSPTRST